MGQEASGIRISKYLSEVGHCSRRAADKLLEQERITLNGVVPELGTKVMPGDTVEVDGKPVGQPTKQEDHVYIAYHKPVGIVCTRTGRGNGTTLSTPSATRNAFSRRSPRQAE